MNSLVKEKIIRNNTQVEYRGEIKILKAVNLSMKK